MLCGYSYSLVKEFGREISTVGPRDRDDNRQARLSRLRHRGDNEKSLAVGSHAIDLPLSCGGRKK